DRPGRADPRLGSHELSARDAARGWERTGADPAVRLAPHPQTRSLAWRGRGPPPLARVATRTPTAHMLFPHAISRVVFDNANRTTEPRGLLATGRSLPNPIWRSAHMLYR